MRTTSTIPKGDEETKAIRRECCVCLGQSLGLHSSNPLCRCACCKKIYHAKCYGIDVRECGTLNTLCQLCDYQINLFLSASSIPSEQTNNTLYNLNRNSLARNREFFVKIFIDRNNKKIQEKVMPLCMICGEAGADKLYSKLTTQDYFVHTICALLLKENKQIITQYIPGTNSFMYTLLPPCQVTQHSANPFGINLYSENAHYFKVKCSFGLCKSILKTNLIQAQKCKMITINNDSPLLKEELRYVCNGHNHKDIHESDESKKYNFIWWLKKESRNEYKEYYHLERYNNYTHQKEKCEELWDMLEADYNPKQKRNVPEIYSLIGMLEGVVPIRIKYDGKELLCYLYEDYFVNCFLTNFSKIVTYKIISNITKSNIERIKQTRKNENTNETNIILSLISNPDIENEEELEIKKKARKVSEEEFQKLYYNIKLFENENEIMFKSKKQQDEFNLDRLVKENNVFSCKTLMNSLDTKIINEIANVHKEIDDACSTTTTTTSTSDMKLRKQISAGHKPLEETMKVLNTERNIFKLQSYLIKKNKKIFQTLLSKYCKFIRILNNKHTRNFSDEMIPDSSIESKKMKPIKSGKNTKLVNYLQYIKLGFEYYDNYMESEDLVTRKRKLYKLETDKNPDNEIEQGQETIHTESNEEIVCCCICLKEDFSDENQIVFCEFCDVSVHQGCYGIDMLPPGEWYCSRCNYYLFVKPEKVFTDNLNCVICGMSSGALKPTYLSGVWCHSICAFWTPETFVGSSCTLEPVFGFENLKGTPETCSICKKPGKGCQPCSVTECKNFMHIPCIQAKGRLEENTHRSQFDYKQYCPKHSIQITRKENELQETNCIPKNIDIEKLIEKTGIKFTNVTTQKQKQKIGLFINFMDKQSIYTLMTETETCSLCDLQLDEPIIKCWVCDISVHLSCYGEDTKLIDEYKKQVEESKKQKVEQNQMINSNINGANIDDPSTNTKTDISKPRNDTQADTSNADCNRQPNTRSVQSKITDHIKQTEAEEQVDFGRVLLINRKLFWVCHSCLFYPKENKVKIISLIGKLAKMNAQKMREERNQAYPSIPKNINYNHNMPIQTNVATRREITPNLRSQAKIEHNIRKPLDAFLNIQMIMCEIIRKFILIKNPSHKLEYYKRRAVNQICFGCQSITGIMKPIVNSNFEKWVHIYCANISNSLTRSFDKLITRKTFYQATQGKTYEMIQGYYSCEGCHITNREFALKICPIEGCTKVLYHGNCMQYSTDINIYRNSYNTAVLCRNHALYNLKYFTHRFMLNSDKNLKDKLKAKKCDICFRMALKKVKHCTRCKITVHSKCMYLDDRFEKEVIIDNWICDICALNDEEKQNEIMCYYCKNNKKVLMRLDSFGKVYVHPICYKIALKEYLYNNINLRQTKTTICTPKINTTYCCLCDNKEGNVYKCTDCDKSAHLTCAQEHPYNEILNILEFNYLSPENRWLSNQTSDAQYIENRKRKIRFLGCEINKPLRLYLFENTINKFKCRQHIKPWDIIGLFNVNCYSCGFGRIEMENALMVCIRCHKFYHKKCYQNLNTWNDENGYTFKCDECVLIEKQMPVDKERCAVCSDTYSDIHTNGGSIRLRYLNIAILKQDVSKETIWCYICDYCERTVSLQNINVKDRINYIDKDKECNICNKKSEVDIGNNCEVVEGNIDELDGHIIDPVPCYNWFHFKCEKKRFFSTRKSFIKNAIMERNYLDFDCCCTTHYNDTFLDCYCSAYIDDKTVYKPEIRENATNLECTSCGDKFHPNCSGIAPTESNKASTDGFKCIRCLFVFNT